MRFDAFYSAIRRHFTYVIINKYTMEYAFLKRIINYYFL